MTNLIGLLLGNILPYCTGTGGYCTVHAGRNGNKRWLKELFSHLAMLGLTYEASCRALRGFVYSKVHFTHCIAQKFSRRG